jgi:hypothetical protein
MSKYFFDLDTLHQKDWFSRLSPPQKELLQQSFYLLDDASSSEKTFYDYSFIVMPASKAFEGFVKDILYSQSLITKKRYLGSRFRVGKALNPNLARDNPGGFENLYDDLTKLTNSEDIPHKLWDTWRQCRNQVFHYFAKREKRITMFDAKHRLQQILHAINDTVHLLIPHKIAKLNLQS